MGLPASGPKKLGALVGLAAEARILRAAMPDVIIGVSGATPEGARRAVAALKRAGVDGLLSFGCAAGLSDRLGPGAVLVPDYVSVADAPHAVDPGLWARFGGGQSGVERGGLLHSDVVIAAAAEKARLARETGCVAVDMESGYVATAGLPFAVLRVVCDDARRDLPPVALAVLAGGRISIPSLVRGLLSRPGQIGALVALGREAARARRAMVRFLGGLARARGASD